MKLKDWLTEKGMTQEQFSEFSGIGQSTISRICVNAWCKPQVALAIYNSTGGAVTPNDIYLSEPA